MNRIQLKSSLHSRLQQLVCIQILKLVTDPGLSPKLGLDPEQLITLLGFECITDIGKNPKPFVYRWEAGQPWLGTDLPSPPTQNTSNYIFFIWILYMSYIFSENKYKPYLLSSSYFNPIRTFFALYSKNLLTTHTWNFLTFPIGCEYPYDFFWENFV